MKTFLTILILAVLTSTGTTADQSREKQMREELRTDPENSGMLYNLACVVSLDGRAEEAMNLLRQAILNGFTHFEHLLVDDPDLTLLREDSAFKERILGYIREREEVLKRQLTEQPYLKADNHFQLAVIAAELDNHDRAVNELQAAFDAGFKDFTSVYNARSFNDLWDRDGFRKMVDDAFNQAYAWTGTDKQKIFGLMTVWAEAKRNFAFFDQIPHVDWDATCQSYIPKVLAVDSVADYYYLLQELTATLQDGHTSIFLPRSVRQHYARVPLELDYIENRVTFDRIGNTDQLAALPMAPGMEVVELGGLPVEEFVDKNLRSRICYGRPLATFTIGSHFLMEGPEDEPLAITWVDFDGNRHSAELKRGLMQSDSSYFKFRVWTTKPYVKAKRFENDIIYCNLETFNEHAVIDEFNALFDTLDLEKVNGFIIDVRENTGGNSSYGFAVISRFLEESIQAAKWKSRKYIPTFRAWGRDESWHEGGAMAEIGPSDGQRYAGPLVVLTGPRTFSAAEDFVVPLDFSNRATIIGDTTGGSTGQPLSMTLPGGGTFRVCTKRDIYPDGTEFVGIGIPPDIVVLPTRQDVIDGHDPVLERAVAYILK